MSPSPKRAQQTCFDIVKNTRHDLVAMLCDNSRLRKRIYKSVIHLLYSTGKRVTFRRKIQNMSKRIVFCADGTWDSTQNDTNVYKLFKAIPVSSDQVAYYDDGVGSDGTLIEKLLGGAFGAGLFQKIKDGYTKIAQVYEPGDDLFIFGFSRGAYTARSLAGMIAVCGLPTASFDANLVTPAFNAYRQKDPIQRKSILDGLSQYNLFDAKLKMVGVWDTVGSLGIPALLGDVDPYFMVFWTRACTRMC
jgi:uncharacterized protein (DUF2235 family)